MERSSFFDAELKGEEYDRVYSAEDYARYFASFIGNGVFPTPSTNLQVSADGTSMNIKLKQGKAWINGYFYENTEDLSLKVDVADGVLNRIDRVVLRLDFINREIKAYVKKGEFASSPTAPTLQRDMDVYELGIADIKINKGVTKITQANITDLRQNNNYCGLVAGVVQQIDTTDLFTQFQTSFDIWFEHMKGQLSEDAAGNIQQQIDNHDSRIKIWEEFKANGGKIGGDITTKNINMTYGVISNEGNAIKIKGNDQKMVSIKATDTRNQTSKQECEIVLIKKDDATGFTLRPTTNGRGYTDLGSDNYKFANAFFSGDVNIGECLKSPNGYAQIGNGLILQWGVLSSTLENRFKNVAVKFPIQFSSDKPKVFINCDWLSGTTSPANLQCNASNLAINGFTATFKADDSMFASSEFSAQWFAIGY